MFQTFTGVPGALIVLCAALLLGGSSAQALNFGAKGIEGVYRLEPLAAEMVVTRLKGEMFRLSSNQGWEGVGILDGSVYRGVFRLYTSPDEPVTERMGSHLIEWTSLDRPIAFTSYFSSTRTTKETWVRIGPLSASRRPPADPRRPEPGDSVHVEDLPEKISGVAPNYPEKALKAGISGQVVVMALVQEDGFVADVRVLKSIPELDEAAITAVRQYRFLPALAGGKPVAVWVAIPVRFKVR